MLWSWVQRGCPCASSTVGMVFWLVLGIWEGGMLDVYVRRFLKRKNSLLNFDRFLFTFTVFSRVSFDVAIVIHDGGAITVQLTILIYILQGVDALAWNNQNRAKAAKRQDGIKPYEPTYTSSRISVRVPPLKQTCSPSLHDSYLRPHRNPVNPGGQAQCHPSRSTSLEKSKVSLVEGSRGCQVKLALPRAHWVLCRQSMLQVELVATTKGSGNSNKVESHNALDMIDLGRQGTCQVLESRLQRSTSCANYLLFKNTLEYKKITHNDVSWVGTKTPCIVLE